MKIAAALRVWILDSASRGCTFDSMVDAMVQSGHKAGYARDALAHVLGPDSRGDGAPGAGEPAARSTEGGSPQAWTVPEPLVDSETPVVETPDRCVAVLAALRVPRIIVFGGVLSPEECEALCALALPRMHRARTVNRNTGSADEHEQRSSDGMFFAPGENELVERIERRMAALMRWPAGNGEGLQILRYGPGGEYQPHYDYFDPSDSGSAVHIRRGGNRVATLIVYLRAPQEGGATTFPDIGFAVAPVAGNAVFFSYGVPSPDSLTLHGGTPVTRGEKWIATKWVRAGKYVE